jgi:hypothetical protein
VVRGLGRHVRLRRPRRCGEELAGTGKVIATTTAGEQAVVADAVKAPWQDVLARNRRMNSSAPSVMAW